MVLDSHKENDIKFFQIGGSFQMAETTFSDFNVGVHVSLMLKFTFLDPCSGTGVSQSTEKGELVGGCVFTSLIIYLHKSWTR